jgi:divalent metal cation (Fe/Co/Zn/Cd) transporter
MKEQSNSLRAVIFALVGNFAIAVIKFIVSVISGSSAIESITAQVKSDIRPQYPNARYIYLEVEEE